MLFIGITNVYCIFCSVNLSLFVSPKSISIGRLETNRPVVVSIQYVSLKDTLRSVLDNKDFREMIDLYMSEENTDLLDYKDGLSYQVKSNDGSLPLVLYFDDFESGNALGSHKTVHKIGAIYFSLRCLRPHMYSQLRNIYLACLFHSRTRERLGNERVLAPLLADLIHLEREGILIEGRQYRVFLAGLD